MIHHISLGVRDLGKAQTFYDAALAPLGYTCLSSNEGSLGYGKDAVALWISPAERPVAHDPQSGLHFCFVAPICKSVDAFYKERALCWRPRQRRRRPSRRRLWR
jgi:catechol 2,3-dioxygenase-like lactoylglutathione lyase family enzyme